MLARDQESGLTMEQTGDLALIVHTSCFDQATEFVDQVLNSGDGLYLFTGKPEVGKTTVLEYCSNRIDGSVKLLANSIRRIDADNLSALLNEAFGVDASTSVEPKGLALRYFLKLGTLRSKGHHFVLIIDDVETIHSSGAELIKALLQMNSDSGGLMTILLCGEDTLTTVLDKSHRWGIQNLIKKNFQMTALELTEADAFIDQIPELKESKSITFKPNAKKVLYRYTEGIPGKLIRLGHHAVKLAARGNAQAVTSRMVKAAVSGEDQSLYHQALGITWKHALMFFVPLLVFITLLSLNLFRQQTTSIEPQPLTIGESQSATAVIKTYSTGIETTQPVSNPATGESTFSDGQPGVTTLEDNIFIGESASIVGPVTVTPERVRYASFYTTIPGFQDAMMKRFQAAHTRISPVSQ